MNCWICGATADSGDHFIKASDLRDLFGRVVSTEQPIFLHTQQNKSLKLQSVKSDYLKSPAKLCKNCNNKVVAPYDDAWTKLFRYVNSQNLKTREEIKIRFDQVYGTSKGKYGIALQLYFVKIFGCKVVADEIPLDIYPMSNCILNTIPLSGFYLRFMKWGPSEILKEAHLTEINEIKLNNKKHTFYLWMYSIGHFIVEVSYIPTYPTLLLNKENNYHPSCARNKYVKILNIEREPKK